MSFKIDVVDSLVTYLCWQEDEIPESQASVCLESSGSVYVPSQASAHSESSEIIGQF